MNVFVNDPCSDPSPSAPFPSNFTGVVQSETEIAVLNRSRGDEQGDGEGKASGRLMVAGFNDSLGFHNNRSGLSGFAYSTTGGKNWIDGGELPLVGKSDVYFGDPVIAVHHKSKTFYYASIYQTPGGLTTLSVKSWAIRVAPAQGQESKSNTRCASDPSSC